ncbi:hypothetical protein [Aureimonas psammosilenae]|uniref:hypothetical protein n=1 Tax=Aureimonas psammosilenae TaxID=2495496 RepID=UPI001260BA81|nr:hypothetical protein [Aureimonas psammosilenae]
MTMIYRFAVAAMTCALAGCMNVSPLPFAQSEQRFGYQGADLGERASSERQEAVALPRQSSLPAPREPEVAAAASAPLSSDPDVSRPALLPYDESRDPHVMAVLLPDISAETTDRVYARRANGTIILPSSAKIPVIETADVREALLAGSHEVAFGETPASQ